MLKFIFGRACSGKTQRIISDASRFSKNGQVVLIVPEQFTFECERYVIRNKDANVQNIKVLSFTRLYNEVTSLIGAGHTPPITDFENIVFINRAIRISENNLKIFKRFAKNTEFAKEIANTIKDFKFSGVSSEELFEASEQIGGVCGGKLNDIAHIMSVYEALIANKFVDPSDYLSRLEDMLCSYNFFKDKAVFFDSFTGFTGQQYKIIKKVLEQASEACFAFCTDNLDDKELGLFYNVNSAVNRIKSIAKSLNIEVAEEIKLEKQFYVSDALRHLETVLCDLDNRGENPNDDTGINLISCLTPRDEAVAAANIIRGLVEDKGYRYRDFIVVARDASTYQKYIEAQCEKNNISCFTDKRVPISTTPLYIYIKTLFELTDSFSTENILNYIKCGFNTYTNEDVFALEEYVYIWDINGAGWKNYWDMPITGLEERPMSEEQTELLKRINSLREAVINDIDRFLKEFKGSALERSEALFKFIDKSKARDRLTLLCEKLEKEGDNYFASVIRQSWDSINEILNSIVRVSDENELSSNEYIEMFLLASDSVNICNTPQMLDEITFGSADRIRPSKPKVAIVLGCNQFVFPKSIEKGGILGQADKQKLEAFGIPLNNDIIKSTVEENYLVYSILCCATSELYILRSDYDMSGASLEPSAFISKIKDSFKNIEEKVFSLTADGEFYPRTRPVAFSELGSLNDSDFYAVADTLASIEPYASGVEQLKNPEEFDDFKIKKENARSLFTNRLYLSASKFDTYHSCRFMYFLKYGLKIGTLKKADLNAMQRGTIAHFVFEKIIERYGKSLANFSDEEISKETDLLIEEYFKGISGVEAILTPKFLFMLSNISKSLKNVITHMANEFKQSDFEPKFCELEISKEGQIPELHVSSNEGEVILTGKIDRVDSYKNAVRVVDYKTGKKSFELSDVLYGLNMQMLIYLYAIIKNGKNVFPNAQPAGILYMPAKSRSKEDKLTMNGLICDDPEIYTAMEKENRGEFIPKLKKGTTSYIDKEAFPLIFKHIEGLMSKMQEELINGNFEPNPTDTIKKGACDYCDYSAVCRKSDMQHKKPVERTAGEVLTILKEGITDEI